MATLPAEDRTATSREGSLPWFSKGSKRKDGFTNHLGTRLVRMLWTGLTMGFILALYSIRAQYTGALACFTVVFTPIGVGIDIVLRAIVKKSENENTSATGEGIKYTMITREDATI